MTRRGTLAFLLVIVAITWQGFLLSLPHTHDQAEVPRYAANCALVGTNSPAHHVHRMPPPLPSRRCLACLSGSSLPLLRGRVPGPALVPAVGVAVAVTTFAVAGTGAVLPNRRAPPASA